MLHLHTSLLSIVFFFLVARCAADSEFRVKSCYYSDCDECDGSYNYYDTWDCVSGWDSGIGGSSNSWRVTSCYDDVIEVEMYTGSQSCSCFDKSDCTWTTKFTYDQCATFPNGDYAKIKCGRGMPAGAIVAIVLGSVGLATVIFVLFVCCCRRCRRKRTDATARSQLLAAPFHSAYYSPVYGYPVPPQGGAVPYAVAVPFVQPPVGSIYGAAQQPPPPYTPQSQSQQPAV